MRILLIGGIFLVSFYSEGQKLRVAIASSLLLPFQELEEQFETQNSIDIELISGSSGSLTTQILNGAPYDLFIAADKAFPDKLHTNELTLDEPKVLFSGQVYLWSRSDITNEIDTFLRDGDFRRIAIANPELAPYGTTVKDWLVRTNIWPQIESKMVYGNAISQVNHYIYTNVVDLAFSSNSAAYSQQLKVKGYWSKIEGAEIALVPYFYVLIKNTEQSQSINDFIDYVTDSQAMRVLRNYGFIVATND